MSWFRRFRKPSALQILQGAEWHCGNCDVAHVGMFDLAAFAPDPWAGLKTYAPNHELALDGDFLSEDFCVLDGEHFLVRCTLDIPVRGLAESFSFGCWGSLSRANFEIYTELFDSGDYAGVGPWTSWLCNDLLGLVGQQPIGCWMFPQLGRQRPVLRLADDSHPLAQMQEDGITPERLLEFYAQSGHPLA